MISTPSEYKYVTGLDGIQIDGGIMPLRSGDAASIIRGEDLAFIAEANGEFRNDVENASVDPVSFDKRITFQQAGNILCGVAMTAYDESASLYSGKFAEYTYNPATYHEDLLNALGLTQVTLPIVSLKYPYIRKVDVDTAFERVRKARRIYGGFKQRTNVDWLNRNEGNGWTPGTGTHTEWDTSQYVRFVESHGSRLKTSGSEWIWTQQGRIWTAPRGNSCPSYTPPADYNGLWRIWSVGAEISKKNASGEYSSTKDFALATSATVDWYELSTTHATAILNSFGTSYIDHSADTDNGAVEARDVYMKRFHAAVWVNESSFIVDVSDRIRW